MPGASEMELVDTSGRILCCSLWPSGSAQENTEVSNGTLFRIRSSIAAQMWATPARTARRVHRHSRAGRALRVAPTCERIGQGMCFPSCLREGPDRRFCGQTSQKPSKAFGSSASVFAQCGHPSWNASARQELAAQSRTMVNADFISIKKARLRHR